MTEEEELEQLMEEALEERDAPEEEESEEEETEDENSSESEDEDEQEESEDEDEDEDDEDEVSEEDETEEEDEDEGTFTPVEIQVAGGNVTISSQEELMKYLEKGASAFNETPKQQSEQELVLEQSGLSAEYIKLTAEVAKGSKEALAKLAQLGKIDVLEIDDEDAGKYQQTEQYNRKSDVEVVAEEIAQNKEHFDNLVGYMNEIPSDFAEAVRGDANLLKTFSGHVESGIAQEVMPKAIHARNMYGGDLMSHYARIGQEVYDSKQVQTRDVSPEERQLRKKASGSRGRDNSKTEVTADDIAEMSDADFLEYQSSFSQ